MACEIIQDLNKSDAGVTVTTVIGDDDLATIKALHEEVDEHIEKWSDISHIKRGLGNQLYNIKGSTENLATWSSRMSSDVCLCPDTKPRERRFASSRNPELYTSFIW